MVDVSSKPVTIRSAHAQSIVWLPPAVSALFSSQSATAATGCTAELVVAKGPVLATAVIAGTQAVKATSSLIPFCHPLLLDKIAITIQHLRLDDSRLSLAGRPTQPASLTAPAADLSGPASEWTALLVDCTVGCAGRTGVEMEALTGASVAALTLYDMLKAISHDIVIADTRLRSKHGGKSQWTQQTTAGQRTTAGGRQ